MSGPAKKRRGKSPMKKCDDLARVIAKRGGVCQSGRESHAGRLEWAHGLPREYKSVRHADWNGFCLCASCHYFFTRHPLEWTDWLIRVWGEDLYWERHRDAQNGGRIDWADVLDRLKARADELELS